MTLRKVQFVMVAILLGSPGFAEERGALAACHISDVCSSSCVSTRECSQSMDSRDCSHRILTVVIRDTACEATKAAQNQLYAMQRIACEESRVIDTAQCVSQKQACLSVEKACRKTRQKASEAKMDEALILWVDDNPDNNVFERQGLIEMGAKVILAANTQAALQQIQTLAVDVIISDFRRSDDPRGGYTLLEEIRKRPNPPAFIIFSSSASPALAHEAKRKGALGETNDPDDLFDLVIAAVKNRRHHT